MCYKSNVMQKNCCDKNSYVLYFKAKPWYVFYTSFLDPENRYSFV